MCFMKSLEDDNQLVRLLSKDLQLEEGHFHPVPVNMEEIREKLKDVIGHLLQHDFERLLNAMYRLDIEESRFREVISGVYGNDVSGKLAEIIIEREYRKVKTRNQYREDQYD